MNKIRLRCDSVDIPLNLIALQKTIQYWGDLTEHFRHLFIKNTALTASKFV